VSDCTSHDTTLALYVAGELDETRLGPLLAHCRDCSTCRQLLELHRDLVDLSARAPEPDEARFEQLHSHVLREVAGRKDTPRVPFASWWATPLRFAAAAAAAIVLFVAGIAAGRVERAPAAAYGNGELTARLLSAVNAEAASNRTLTDTEDSRFTFSDVSFRRLPADQVSLGFNLVTHVELVESVHSELVREALVQSLLNSPSPGARLKAISYAAGATEPKVRQALIFALHHDDSLAIRLQALTILSDEMDDPEVKAAVLTTLREDESVQVRLLAIDYLATHRIDRDRIRDLLQENPQPGDEALRVRLAEYES
jgi:hypothetical protein